MTEEKAKRNIIAFTVGAVLLLFILLSVMIYQLISIKIYKDRVAELDAEIAIYEQMLADGEDTLQSRRQWAWIEFRARELGLTKELENKYGE